MNTGKLSGMKKINKTGRCLRRQVNAKATYDNIRTHNTQRAEVLRIIYIWEKRNQ